MKISEKQIYKLIALCREYIIILPNDSIAYPIAHDLLLEIFNQQSEELIEVEPIISINHGGLCYENK